MNKEIKDTYIVGVDSSKRCTGVSIIKHFKQDSDDVFELVDKWLIKTKLIKGQHLFQSELESYLQMTSTMQSYIDKIAYAAFEGFAFGGQGLTQLSGTAAVYQLYYAQNNKPVIHIAPTRVKLIIGGSGKSEKEQVREGLRKYLINFDDIVWKSYDESDAVAIAIASAIINLYPERFPARIKKVRKKAIKI